MRQLMVELGESAYRGEQLYHWVFAKGIKKLAEISNFSQKLLAKLNRRATIEHLNYQLLTADTDQCQKLIFTTKDKLFFETVIIPQQKRLTICLSSQIGCALNCQFCQTAKMGFKRDLTDWEIIEQIFKVKEIIAAERISNLVFMGMGEPLLNFANVKRAILQLVDNQGLNFSKKKITVSSSGVIPHFKEVVEELGVRLAVSLNAVEQQQRSKLMPINKKFSLTSLLSELRSLKLATREKITFEYILFANLNDRAKDAELFVEQVKGIPCKVNLILWNEIEGVDLKQSTLYRMEKFRQILERAGIRTTFRRSRGKQIGAACGQLGKETIKEKQ